MEKEFTRMKIVIAAVVGLIFVIMIGLFIVSLVTKNMNNGRSSEIAPAAKSLDMNTQKEEMTNIDEIEFEDPGDDEIGKEIKELDDLINDTQPSELDGGDLSDETIGGEVELE